LKSSGIYTIVAQDIAQPVSLVVGGVGVVDGTPGSSWNWFGSWEIVDSQGNVLSMVTVPNPAALPPGQYSFDVSSLVLPNVDLVNPATLTYVCPVVFSCDYCPSYRILVSIEDGLPAHAEIG
jgi:hypothetical protein